MHTPKERVTKLKRLTNSEEIWGKGIIWNNTNSVIINETIYSRYDLIDFERRDILNSKDKQQYSKGGFKYVINSHIERIKNQVSSYHKVLRHVCIHNKKKKCKAKIFELLSHREGKEHRTGYICEDSKHIHTCGIKVEYIGCNPCRGMCDGGENVDVFMKSSSFTFLDPMHPLKVLINGKVLVPRGVFRFLPKRNGALKAMNPELYNRCMKKEANLELVFKTPKHRPTECAHLPSERVNIGVCLGEDIVLSGVQQGFEHFVSILV